MLVIVRADRLTRTERVGVIVMERDGKSEGDTEFVLFARLQRSLARDARSRGVLVRP